MNCRELSKLIHAYEDRELDAAHTLLVDSHLADCPQCFASLRRLSSFRSALPREELSFSAPPHLRTAIRTALSHAAESEKEPLNRRPWLQYGGWAAAAVALTVAVFGWMRPLHGSDLLAENLTATHIRSLMVQHLTDVASTDQHTVKPWFDGKLDFAPPVRDLKDSGFPLLGGRLDYLAGRPVAALVYGRKQHFINLFVWPTSSGTPQRPRASDRQGYNLEQWSDGKMNFAAVSDLNPTELRVFVTDWAEK